jgi:3-phenylpropionate/trans-cinnamate dioxygenase ferredoxin reductase subunit
LKEIQMPDYTYLIIGGGMAADAAVRGIRELDPAGTIGLLSSEPDPPYNRPPLTKALWKGKDLDTIWRRTEERQVALHLGTSVSELHLKGRTVVDREGQTYGYGKLLLATGGRPRRFPFGGDSILYYRSLRDYRRLRAQADEMEHFVVIGGGFVGSELAAALQMNGRHVTMLFPEASIGALSYPADLAESVDQFFLNKGVDLRPSTTVVDVTGEPGALSVILQSGDRLETQSVVAGIGITPNTGLAEAAGLVVDNGIVVDSGLQTSQPGVYAAGDVASFFNPALGERMRVEHEDNANTMGQMAGRAMAGEPVQYHHLPFFYSDLFELGYEAVGKLDSQLETVADWQTPFKKGVVYYLESGRVRGVLLWDVWGKVDAARALIAEPGPVSPDSLMGAIPAD